MSVKLGLNILCVNKYFFKPNFVNSILDRVHGFRRHLPALIYVLCKATALQLQDIRVSD